MFREWPYLYEGSREYEEQYLKPYIDCQRSLAVLVWDGDRCVGASTCMPLEEAPPDIQRPFAQAGRACAGVAYFGESVLLPEYRGRGLGVMFFDMRERHARSLGLLTCAFSVVERPNDHPLRPSNYVPNDEFWRRRGYCPDSTLRTTLSWPDIGQADNTPKPMTFWVRALEVQK